MCGSVKLPLYRAEKERTKWTTPNQAGAVTTHLLRTVELGVCGVEQRGQACGGRDKTACVICARHCPRHRQTFSFTAAACCCCCCARGQPGEKGRCATAAADSCSRRPHPPPSFPRAWTPPAAGRCAGGRHRAPPTAPRLAPTRPWGGGAGQGGGQGADRHAGLERRAASQCALRARRRRCTASARLPCWHSQTAAHCSLPQRSEHHALVGEPRCRQLGQGWGQLCSVARPHEQRRQQQAGADQGVQGLPLVPRHEALLGRAAGGQGAVSRAQ